MKSKVRFLFRSVRQTANYLTLTLGMMLTVFVANAQVFTSVPALNIYTSTGINYSGCTSNGSTIRARIISYSGTNATIQVNMINGYGFGNSGTLYLRETSPCSSSNLNSTSYVSVQTSVTITLNLSNLQQNQSITFIPTMVSYSGTRCHTGTITITNNCPVNMQWYSQVNPAWGSNLMNNSCTISNAGCVISCIAMLLASQEGNPTNSYTPATLNTYLNTHYGYIPSCTLASWYIPADMDGSGGITFIEPNYSANNWSWLDNQLSQCRKVVVNVNSGNHWVLVTAKTGPSGIGSSYKVLDPGNSNYTGKTLANFSNTYLQGRSYAGTWKTNMPYLKPMINESDGPLTEDYETFQIEGTDGWLVPKSLMVGTNEVEHISIFKVYPNPVGDDQITIEMEEAKAGNVLLMLTDLAGKVVTEIAVNSTVGVNIYQLPMGGIKNGLYFLTVRTETRTLTQKVQVLK